MFGVLLFEKYLLRFISVARYFLGQSEIHSSTDPCL